MSAVSAGQNVSVVTAYRSHKGTAVTFVMKVGMITAGVSVT